MYKIFFNSRAFIISDNFEECFSQINGVAAKINTPDEMGELLTYFETAYQTHSLWLYAPDTEKAFAWFSACFSTIEAAGGLVQNKNNDYLLIYRFERWDLPKGKREKKETPEETALREVEEECSLSNLNLYSHITDTYHTYRLNNKLCLKKTYWYKMKYNGTLQPSPQTEELIEKAVWVSDSHLYEYVIDMYASIKEVFIEAGIKLIH
ncbi:MAG: NUDIX domain-containing protein [Prevotellaceae bacterium]|jgi:ADP-ribose pyrophosphatase YjhB (NUDIX family)|nr:NUDIX domain-containing protein [Prevotellaceae bacterium]